MTLVRSLAAVAVFLGLAACASTKPAEPADASDASGSSDGGDKPKAPGKDASKDEVCSGGAIDASAKALADDAVTAPMKQLKDKVRGCVRGAKAAGGDVSGTLAIAVQVGPDGSVATACATGLTSQVRECASHAATDVKFPAGAGVARGTFDAN